MLMFRIMSSNLVVSPLSCSLCGLRLRLIMSTSFFQGEKHCDYREALSTVPVILILPLLLVRKMATSRTTVVAGLAFLLLD